MMAVLAAAGCLWGQEKRWSLDYEASIGLARYVNYPSLSVLQDATPSYTGLTSAFTLGMRRDDGFSLGLRYRNTETFTAAVAHDEKATVHEVSVVVRQSAMLTQNVELFGAATLGFAILHNSLSDVGNKLGFNRYGFSAALEAGVRYYMSDEVYLNFTLGIGTVAPFEKSLDIPNHLLPHTRNSLTAVSAMGGFGIGLKSKGKRINMPQALIQQSQPLQLAWYTD